MTTAALRFDRLGTMAVDGDANWWGWLSAVSALSAILSFGFGVLTTRWKKAEDMGVERGAAMIWRTSVETNITAMETRLNAKISSLEIRKDRTDEMLQDIPRRAEMNAGFQRIEAQQAELRAQFSVISQFLHKDRD